MSSPRQEPLPLTLEAWRHLAGLYDKVMLEDKEEIARLKKQVNTLRQSLDSYRSRRVR